MRNPYTKQYHCFECGRPKDVCSNDLCPAAQSERQVPRADPPTKEQWIIWWAERDVFVNDREEKIL